MQRIVTRNQFTATYTGRSEFYSGIRSGERVLLTVETTIYWMPTLTERSQRSSSHLSIQKIDGNSAHLGVKLGELADIRPLGAS